MANKFGRKVNGTAATSGGDRSETGDESLRVGDDLVAVGDPASAAAAPDPGAADTEPVKRRGRPRGRGKGRAGAKVSVPPALGISSILYSIHLGIAAITQESLWQLSQEEADALGAAIENVAAQYDWLSKLTPEIVAWGQLVTVAATIYGGRLVLLKVGAGRPVTSASSPVANGTAPQGPPGSMVGLLHPHMTEING